MNAVLYRALIQFHSYVADVNKPADSVPSWNHDSKEIMQTVINEMSPLQQHRQTHGV